MTQENLLGTGDVAKMLKVSTSTVRRLVDSGHLRTEITGGRHVFKRDVVEAYAAKTLKRTVGYSPQTKESTLRALRDMVLALREENERLREAAKQAREALQDCLRSASTNRLVDVIGDAMTALEQAGVKP
jgi:excisionase family DNA binding protein